MTFEIPGRRLDQATLSYWLVAATALGIARFWFAQSPPRTAFLDAVLWVGFAVTIVAVAIPAGSDRATRFWLALPVGFAVLAVANLIFGWVSTSQYGDAVYMGTAVEQQYTMQRWLGPLAILTWGYSVLFRFPPVARLFADQNQAVEFFVSLASITVVCGASVALLRRWPRQLRVLLPTLSPIWLLFAVGYVEIYPFIAPILLASLCWMFDRPLEERRAHHVGILAGILFPLAYIGFAPVSGLLLVCYCAVKPRATARTFVAAGATALVGIELFWPSGILQFLGSYYDAIPKGEASTTYVPYLGYSAGADSFWFSRAYALSGEHLHQVAFMLFFGVGLMLLPLLTVTAVRAVRVRQQELSAIAHDARTWLGLGLVSTAMVYAIWMIPRLGPVMDIDLFFSVYLTLAFLAGLLLDLTEDEPGALARPILTAALLAAAGVSSSLLVFRGIELP